MRPTTKGLRTFEKAYYGPPFKILQSRYRDNIGKKRKRRYSFLHYLKTLSFFEKMDFQSAYFQIHGKNPENDQKENRQPSTGAKDGSNVTLKMNGLTRPINFKLTYQSPKKRCDRASDSSLLAYSPIRSRGKTITDSTKKRLDVLADPISHAESIKNLTKEMELEETEPEDVEIVTSTFTLEKKAMKTRRVHDNKDNFVKINMRCKKYINKKTSHKKFFKKKLPRK
ncbi:unnamed protein product [Bursaphelenchus xylophilus]|uniref:(pine wood nematode) hypothetical protein n=1 Tax=Bursaphelenchus xylophilus TaxID=6326 RepID=A0A1I7S7D7_BURXY|nr:unnamed protein product [Bursaphelenchus xylophilus]CAG9084963.1 unnamed protein product [Bursaphelenchus xylophilus]